MKRYLIDYFPNYSFDESGDYLIVNNRKYTIYITLNERVSDSECCRVRIKGKYYYFG